MKQAGAIIGAVLMIASVVGVSYALKDTVATKAEVSAVSERLDNKILDDRIAALQERIWNMEDRWSERFFKRHDRYPATTEELVAFMSEEARGTYRDMVEELEALEEQRARKA